MTNSRTKPNATGDFRGFEPLCKSWVRTINELRQEAYGLTGDQRMADDLVQLVLEEALHALPSGNEPLQLKQWLSMRLRSAYRENSPHLH